MSCCQSVFCAADNTLRIQCLIWRYGTHLSQCSVSLCGILVALEISALITNKSQKLLTVSHLLQISFHAAFVYLHPKSSTEEVLSLCKQSAVCVFLSPSLCEWHLYCPVNDAFFGPIEQLHFHQTFWYLNGIKQMRWVEHRLNGHWSGSVISTSTLHDVCYRIKETGVLSIMGSAAAPSVECWVAWIWAQSHNQYDRCVSLLFSVNECILLDVLTGVVLQLIKDGSACSFSEYFVFGYLLSCM